MIDNGVSEATIADGKSILTFFLSLGKVMIILEFIFYVLMFQNLAQRNRSLKDFIQKDILKVQIYSIYVFCKSCGHVLNHKTTLSFRHVPEKMPSLWSVKLWLL